MQPCLRNPARPTLLILLLLGALALAACGDDEGSEPADAGPDPATLVPAGAPVYAEAVVRPEGEQKDDLLAALSKLTGDSDPAGLIQGEIAEAVAASDSGLDYEEDVLSWLGARAAVFVSDFDGEQATAAAVVATTDPEATAEAIRKAAEASEEEVEERSYEGVDYVAGPDGDAAGVVGDFLVAGTEQGFEQAVDTQGGEALAGVAEATDALAEAPEGSIFRAVVDADRLLDLAVDAGEVEQRDLEQFGEQLDTLREAPVVISGQAGADAIGIELTAAAGKDRDSGATVAELPAGAWLAFSTPEIGRAVSEGFDSFIQSFESSFRSSLGGLPSVPGGGQPQIPDIRGEIEGATGLDLSRDLDWAGDLSAFVSGTSIFNLGGGFVIETDDPEAAADAVEKLRTALAREPSLNTSETADGFQLQIQGAPVGAEVAVREDSVVLAAAGSTIDEILQPDGTLGDDAGFSSAADALGSGLTPSFYLDPDAIVALVDSTGQSGGEFEQARPVLEAIDFLIAGGGVEADRGIGRIVLGLQDPPPAGEAAVLTAP